MADPDDIDLAFQLRIGIWVAQAILTTFCLSLGLPLLANPAAPPAGFGIDFAAQLPDLVARGLGLAYLLLGLGVLLPSVLRIRPLLAVASAALIAVLQVGLLAIHAARGELQGGALSIDLMLILLAAGVLWGRGWYAPIGAR